jgi:imidazolonepropionase-like amidohydrolase
MTKLCLTVAFVCLWVVALSAADSNSVLIRNATIHPVTGPEIQNSSVLILDGRIAEIGPKLAPRAAIRTVDARGLHLYPGLINAATNIGLAEIQALRDTVDLDEVGMFNPELRAAIAFNPSSEHIEVTRAAGITSVVSLPGSGGRRAASAGGILITGQGALMHLDGWTGEEMTVNPGVVMDLLFPEVEREPRPGSATPPLYKEEQRQYAERLRELSEFFEQARRYQKAMAARGPDFRRDLRLEAMAPVLEGLQPIAIRAERERSIRDAVAFADKEKVKIIIADPREIGGAGPLLKERHIPVILGRAFQLPMRDDDPYDAPYTLAAQFYRAGVKICFGTFDVQFARNVGFEAAQAAAFGLPREEALKALTINSAEILGVGDRLGSIEKGKLGDLILTDGDPLEARTNIRQMFIAGREVSLESRHTREYEKWMKRP